MAAPASYSELELGQYMDTLLGATADALGWGAPSGSLAGTPYEEPVNDALLLYGVGDITSATDIEKLRAAARLAIWRAVEAVTAANYDFSTDGQRFNRAQIHDHAVAQVKRGRVDGMRHGIEHRVSVLAVRNPADYYRYQTDEMRQTT